MEGIGRIESCLLRLDDSYYSRYCFASISPISLISPIIPIGSCFDWCLYCRDYFCVNRGIHGGRETFLL